MTDQIQHNKEMIVYLYERLVAVESELLKTKEELSDLECKLNAFDHNLHLIHNLLNCVDTTLNDHYKKISNRIANTNSKHNSLKTDFLNSMKWIEHNCKYVLNVHFQNNRRS